MNNFIRFSSVASRLGLLLKPVKKRALTSSIILIFQGITEGVGLLLIIPLLGIIGIESIEHSNSSLSAFINRFFETINVPLSLFNVLIIYLSIISFYAVLKYFQNINTARINQKVIANWRFKFFQLLSNAAWNKIQFLKTSTLHEVLTNEVRKLGSITNQLVQFFSAFIIILIYFTLSLLLSVKLTALAILPIGILLLLNRPLNKKTYSIGQSLVQKNQSLYKTIEEHLAAIRLVKAYNKEIQEAEAFKKISDGVEKFQLQYVKTNNRTKVIFEILAAFSITAYVYFAISNQIVPIGELLLLLFIFARIFPKVGNIVSSYQTILNTIPSFEVVLTYIEQLKNKVQPESTSLKNVHYEGSIQFKNVYFSYSDQPVLSDLSISIPFQKTTAIIGQSGAGKSTVIDLILGLQLPLEGQINIGNHTLKDLNLNDWRDKIGYVPQDPFLFNGSIKDNLLWVKPDATHDELWNALEQSSAADFVKNLPDQMDAFTGNRGTQLSGGERQRIALARALLKNPTLLILDEATSAIDNENEQLIKEALNRLHHKITIVIVAHRSNLTDLADHTIQL